MAVVAAALVVAWMVCVDKMTRGRVTKVGPLAELRQAEGRGGRRVRCFAFSVSNFQ